MPAIDKHAPGAFCWPELGTTDRAGAKKFYEGLFSWAAEDVPAGPGMIYTMLRLEGREVGALYELRPEQRQQGVPPNWLIYVAVESADHAAEKAKSLGGQVLMGPFDVMDVGRMAVIRDPQGAVFAVWQAKLHIGTRIAGVNGTMGWSELHTPDTEAGRKFYTGLFGWGAKVSDMGPMKYTEWVNQGQSIGGMMQLDPAMKAPPNWLTYFMVGDCDATVARAKELGGSICMPPMDIPKVGRFAVLTDPQGAAFAVIKVMPPQ